MILSLIVAVADNGVIGDGTAMPWHIPAELAYFKAMTWGKPVIMGRRTHQSIGRPLPGRQNIVLTRDPAWSSPGVTIVHGLEAALAVAAGAEEVMVIGGGTLYEITLPQARRLYLTKVHVQAEGTVRFPAVDPAQWQVVSQRASEPGTSPAYDTLILERRPV